MKTSELEDFVNTLVQPGKIAGSDLDNLSLHELEAMMGLDLSTETEKSAYLSSALKCGGPGDSSWLDQFAGTPLHAKAVQIAEEELAVEQERLQRRMQRQQESSSDDDLWTREDALRLQKSMLSLELHKANMGQGGGKDPSMEPMVEPVVEPAEAPKEKKASAGPDAKKLVKLLRGQEGSEAAQELLHSAHRHGAGLAAAGGTVGGLLGGVVGGKIVKGKSKEKTSADIQTVGQINNGDPKQPEWPRAALGVDSAGRRATPEEEAAQAQTSGTVAFKQPESGEKTAKASEKTHEKSRLRKIHEDTPLHAGLGSGLGSVALGLGGMSSAPRSMGTKGKVLGGLAGASLGALGGGLAGAGHSLAARKAYRGIDKLRGSRGVNSDPTEDWDSASKEKKSGLGTQLGEKVLGKAVESGAIGHDLVRKGLNAAQQLGSRLGGKTTESALGRGLAAAGGTAAVGAGTLMAGRRKQSAQEGRLGLPFRR